MTMKITHTQYGECAWDCCAYFHITFFYLVAVSYSTEKSTKKDSFTDYRRKKNDLKIIFPLVLFYQC